MLSSVRTRKLSVYALKSLACSRHGRRLAADNLSVCRHRQVDICLHCSAWWGFASRPTSDLQRLEAFNCRSDRCGFVPANLPTFADLCENADDKLSNAITSDCNYVLHYLLPSQSQGSQHYDLRQRPHNFSLPSRTGHLTDKNYIQRMLYFNSY